MKKLVAILIILVFAGQAGSGTEWVLGLPVSDGVAETEWVLGMPVARDSEDAPAVTAGNTQMKSIGPGIGTGVGSGF